jgi:maltose-binding protein MalE
MYIADMAKTENKRGRGRPETPDSEKRDKLRVTVPLNEEEKAEIKKAVAAFSAEVGVEVTEAAWARKILLDAAKREIVLGKR